MVAKLTHIYAAAAREPVAIVEPFDPAQLPIVEAVFGSGGLRKFPRVPRGATWCIRWSATVASIPKVGMARWSVYGQLGMGQYYNHYPGTRLHRPGLCAIVDFASSSYRTLKRLEGPQKLIHACSNALFDARLADNNDRVLPANIVVLSGSSYVLWTGSYELGHKHLLHDNFERCIALCGDDASSVAHFWPRCWQLSSQPQREAAMAAVTRAYTEWSQNSCDESGAGDVARETGQRQLEEPLWILKPINQSRGRGIRLISQWEEISSDEVSGYLVQR